MPYLTVQSGPGGAVLDAWVGISQARRTALAAENQPQPPPIQVRALIDTGASHTCVDPSVLHPLNLTPGSTHVNTPTTGGVGEMRDLYDISFMVPNGKLAPLVRRTMPVICTELFPGIHVLIGRDILQDCLFTFDGRSSLFSLAY